LNRAQQTSLWHTEKKKKGKGDNAKGGGDGAKSPRTKGEKPPDEKGKKDQKSGTPGT